MSESMNFKQRKEIKYRLSKEQLAFFETKIAEHMEIDAYGLTSIASLYYDTPDYRLINRSIEKPFFKEKLRLRSYGLADEDSRVYLEIKRKNAGIVYKRRAASSEGGFADFIEGKASLGNSQIERELQAFLGKYGVLEPKYLIIYDRVAYFEKGGDLRVTIDRNPRYRNADLDLHTSMEGTPLLEEGEAILEVKAQGALPLWLSELLAEGKIYQTSFSKVGTAHMLEMKKKPVFISSLIHSEQRRLGYGLSI